ncbi:MAG TPA: DUF3182 family protein [Crenalkalicoccus sp.]|nr:DUF3182 family protein [Crenalkalicoccus sp.]
MTGLVMRAARCRGEVPVVPSDAHSGLGTAMDHNGAAGDAARGRPAVRGLAVVYSADGRGFAHRHERATRAGIAERLAALMGVTFAGEYAPSGRGASPLYFVPSDTLVGPEAAALGVRGEHDLFGGVVPHLFAATKAITHQLVRPDAHAPTGWSHEFGRRVRDIVLRGFAAFTLEDARHAGMILLESGPVRIKPARATGGHGQTMVTSVAGLEAALGAMDGMELGGCGLVVEEHLADVTTYSVGQVRVADLVASYYGVQRLTPDNGGASVYGGSDLVVARGGFDALLPLDPPEGARIAVAQARAYDAAATECFPGLFASRRNYDVARGLDADGHRRSGVLEQSWRAGGASGAEIAALEAFRAEPALRVVRASTVEAYGGSVAAPPPHATVYFRGVDERVGPITKYALIEPHDDPCRGDRQWYAPNI